MRATLIVAPSGTVVAVGGDISGRSMGGIAYSVDAGHSWVVAVTGADTLVDVTYANNQFIAVGDNGTVMTSADGTSWGTATAPPMSPSIGDVAYGNGAYVVGTADGQIFSSPDLTTWTLALAQSAVHDRSWGGLRFGNGVFVAVSTQDNELAYSTDGMHWLPYELDSAARLADVAYDGTQFLVFGVGAGPKLWSSIVRRKSCL